MTQRAYAIRVLSFEPALRGGGGGGVAANSGSGASASHHSSVSELSAFFWEFFRATLGLEF